MFIPKISDELSEWAKTTIRANIDSNTFEDAVYMRVRNSPNTNHYYVFFKDSHKDIENYIHTRRLDDKLKRFITTIGGKPENVTAYRVPNGHFPKD